MPWIVSFPSATLTGLAADHMIKTGMGFAFNTCVQGKDCC